MLSAAFVAVTEQFPLASVTDRVLPVTEQPVDEPALYVTAPVPLPPVVLNADVLPYATVDGVATAVSVAWLTFCSVTGSADEVAAL